jgi:hypothetical protein
MLQKGKAQWPSATGLFIVFFLHFPQRSERTAVSRLHRTNETILKRNVETLGTLLEELVLSRKSTWQSLSGSVRVGLEAAVVRCAESSLGGCGH